MTAYRHLINQEVTHHLMVCDVTFQLTGKPPNLFHRLMLKLFFGIKIKVLKKAADLESGCC